MKKFAYLIAVALLVSSAVSATTTNKISENKNGNTYVNGYGNSFIFIEGGIEFSVFPDGQFDFYMPNYGPNVNVGVSSPNVSFSFNSGYDYSPYVQYDDFGAIVQIENIPIYYDYYGRIVGAGNINIRYNNVGYVQHIGGMNVFYRGNVFSHCSGYINVYNRQYIARPWHRFYAVPVYDYRVVYARPYRQYYEPVRYTYYSPYRSNHRTKIYYDYGRKNVVYRDGRRSVGSRISERYNHRNAQGVASSPRNDLRSSANSRVSYNTANRNSSRMSEDASRTRNTSGSRIANRASVSANSRERNSGVAQNRISTPQRTARPAATDGRKYNTAERTSRTNDRAQVANRNISNRSTQISRPNTGERTVANRNIQKRQMSQTANTQDRKVENSSRATQARSKAPSRNTAQTLNRKQNTRSTTTTSRGNSRSNNE